jgi:hypothetical protein
MQGTAGQSDLAKLLHRASRCRSRHRTFCYHTNHREGSVVFDFHMFRICTCTSSSPTSDDNNRHTTGEAQEG